jgi:hypothetical protein
VRGLFLLLLALALAQPLPQKGGRYAYSDGTLQELLPGGGEYRLRYIRGGEVFREDRLRLAPEGVYLLGVGLLKGYFPFDPPLFLYPQSPYPGQAHSGSARFQGQKVALSWRVEGLEGLRVAAGAYNAWRLRLAYTTEKGGTELKEVYLVPGLGVVAFRVGGSWVELLRFSPF